MDGSRRVGPNTGPNRMHTPQRKPEPEHHPLTASPIKPYTEHVEHSLDNMDGLNTDLRRKRAEATLENWQGDSLQIHKLFSDFERFKESIQDWAQSQETGFADINARIEGTEHGTMINIDKSMAELSSMIGQLQNSMETNGRSEQAEHNRTGPRTASNRTTLREKKN